MFYIIISTAWTDLQNILRKKMCITEYIVCYLRIKEILYKLIFYMYICLKVFLRFALDTWFLHKHLKKYKGLYKDPKVLLSQWLGPISEVTQPLGNELLTHPWEKHTPPWHNKSPISQSYFQICPLTNWITNASFLNMVSSLRL